MEGRSVDDRQKLAEKETVRIMVWDLLARSMAGPKEKRLVLDALDALAQPCQECAFWKGERDREHAIRHEMEDELAALREKLAAAERERDAERSRAINAETHIIDMHRKMGRHA
jgi:hypothetical protein